MFIDPKHVMTMPKFMTNTPDTKSQLAKAKMEADAATICRLAAQSIGPVVTHGDLIGH